ncbi:MAG: proton-conducting transporter transmembrane domain-containing protein [Candidatus Freyarchaeota archaeon]|nr:proton-conducting transporter membrane subunit [Candidatus Freyrarchaeum guaymaensis]
MLSDVTLLYPIIVPIVFAIIVLGAGTLFERVAGGKLQLIREILAVIGFIIASFYVFLTYWQLRYLQIISDWFQLSAGIFIPATLYYEYMPAGYWMTFAYQVFMNGQNWLLYKATMPPAGSVFAVDFLSILMAAAFTGLGLAVSIYSIRYMEHDTGKTKYYALLLILVAAMNGVAFAGDLFTLFVFFEIMSISAYSLVGFRKENWEPVEAGFKYLLMGAVGSSMVLYAISILYGLTGTLNFAYLGTLLGLGQALNPWTFLLGGSTFYLVIILLIIGFGVKAAIVPVHTWLPDAHPAAPSGISAMLSGVVIKAGVYSMARSLFVVFPVTEAWPWLVPINVAPYNLPAAFPTGFPGYSFPFHWNYALVVFAIITLIVANVMALLQQDIKRLLAYSSILNIGFIMVGISIGTAAGVTAGLFHLINHAIAKGLLFLGTGVYLHATGSRMLNDLSGIGRKTPITSLSFAIGTLALMGIPPLNGFWSKALIVLSALWYAPFVPEGWVWVTVALATILASAFSAAFYLRLIYVIWFSPESERVKAINKRESLVMALPIAVLAFACIAFGVYPSPLYSLANRAAEALLYIPNYFSGIV